MDRASFYINEIKKLKDERRAVILAHNYQRPEIQDLADYAGDSLGLAQQAATTDADIIVFCGVHFMAETAYILNPEKTVLMPEPAAGCPLADMITVSELEELKARHPGVPVVCYVNSSAAVKAASDVSCTSSNAVSVVNSLSEERAIFVPDENLGRYVAKNTGKDMILWPGFCPTHKRITVEQIRNLKSEHEGAAFMAHPECSEEVLALADHTCSTSGMYSYARESSAATIIVGSEMGMIHRLRRENPEKTFLLPSRETICPNMKMTTLKKVYLSLRNLETVVSLPEHIVEKAQAATKRMFSVLA